MTIEIEFIKKNQKIGMQNSYRNIVSKNSIIFQYDIDLAHGMLYMCLKRNTGTKDEVKQIRFFHNAVLKICGYIGIRSSSTLNKSLGIEIG